MDQVNPDFIGAVLEIWDDARFDGLDFYSEFGPRTLQRLFEIHPESKEVFGVNQNPKMFQARVDAHAKSLVLLVDGVFQMLTNQPDMMDQVFEQLGQKHEMAGVTKDLFPHMGAAIGYALETFMEEPFTDDEKYAWGEVYTALAYEITKFYTEDGDDEDEDSDQEAKADATMKEDEKDESPKHHGHEHRHSIDDVTQQVAAVSIGE